MNADKLARQHEFTLAWRKILDWNPCLGKFSGKMCKFTPRVDVISGLSLIVSLQC